MKKAYVAPKLNASMNGTLEGVYACYEDDNSSNKQNSTEPDGGYCIGIEIIYGFGYGYGNGNGHHRRRGCY